MKLSNTLIVIPTFNAAKFIRRTIDSALNQSKKSMVYVIDNCSTDNTQNICHRYANKNSNFYI